MQLARNMFSERIPASERTFRREVLEMRVALGPFYAADGESLQGAAVLLDASIGVPIPEGFSPRGLRPGRELVLTDAMPAGRCPDAVEGGVPWGAGSNAGSGA